MPKTARRARCTSGPSAHTSTARCSLKTRESRISSSKRGSRGRVATSGSTRWTIRWNCAPTTRLWRERGRPTEPPFDITVPLFELQYIVPGTSTRSENEITKRAGGRPPGSPERQGRQLLERATGLKTAICAAVAAALLLTAIVPAIAAGPPATFRADNPVWVDRSIPGVSGAIAAVQVKAGDPQHVAVVDGTNTLYSSQDSGLTWAPSLVAPGLPLKTVTASKATPGTFYALQAGTVLGSQVYVSNNAGALWASLPVIPGPANDIATGSEAAVLAAATGPASPTCLRISAWTAAPPGLQAPPPRRSGRAPPATPPAGGRSTRPRRQPPPTRSTRARTAGSPGRCAGAFPRRSMPPLWRSSPAVGRCSWARTPRAAARSIGRTTAARPG